MELVPTRESTVPFKVPAIFHTDCFTSYKIFGDVSSGVRPLLAIHGGPGSGHEYLLPFAQLWPRYGVPVIFYDQVGCGASTHLQQFAGDASVWNENTFIAELDNLIDHLGLRVSGFHILGHSWGGMLGAAYAALRPHGLCRLVLANSPAAVETYVTGIRSLCEQFPPDVRKTVEDAHREGDYSSLEYKAAADLFLRRHFYRLQPFPPPELEPRMKHQATDPSAYQSMYGPSAMICTGTLKGWTCVSRLSKISVPTLIYNAEFDCTTDTAVAPLFELIPQVRWLTFPGGGHMCHLEGQLRDKVLIAVGEFLTVKYTE